MSSARLKEFGLVLAGLGALAFIAGSAIMLSGNRSYEGPSQQQHRQEKMSHLIGGLLLALGFALQFASSLSH